MFLFGVIVSVCSIPGWTGTAIPTQYAVLSAVLPFTLWRNGTVTVFHWVGIALVTYAATSILWNTDVYGAVYGLWVLCILALCFWLGSTLQSLRAVYAGLAVGAVLSSAVSIVHVFGYQLFPVGTQHPAGIYYNSIVQGEVLALVAVALLTERMYWQAALLVPGIAISQSRGAWLALLIGVLALRIRKSWLLLAAVAVVGFSMWLGGASDAHRFRIWLAAYGDLSWLGNGVGSFASQLYNDNGAILYPEHAHNDALQFIYEYGFMALAPAIVFGFALSQTQSREWPVIMAFVTMGFYSFPAWLPITAFVGFMAAGRIVRSWHMDGRFRDYCGSVVVARLRRYGGQNIPVVSENPGSC